jgi:Endonuclease/Exonuclease/phosphatase family
MADINSTTLSSDPNFNFVNTILKNSNEELNFISSESPYDHIDINCSYNSEIDFINLYKSSCKPYVLSLNIQSINAKFSEFKTFIESLLRNNCAPDVICLQEVLRICADETLSLSEHHPIVFKCRSYKVQGGGVALYVRNTHNFRINDDLSIFSDRIFESLFINVDIFGKNYIIGSVYRPGTQHPTLNLNEQFCEFSNILSSIFDVIPNKSNFYLFGDINLDCLKYDSCPFVTDYINLLFSYGLLQLVPKPTRCTRNSATVIDHIITNCMSPIVNISILTSLLSEHFPIAFFLDTVKMPKPAFEKKSRGVTEETLLNFSNNLGALSWDSVLTQQDPQLAFNDFDENLRLLYDLHFPIITTKFNKNFQKLEPWFTQGLLTSRRNKILLKKSHFNNPTDVSLFNYKRYRNMYNKLTRAAKKLYFTSELTKHQSNLKKTWSLINKALNKGSYHSNSSVSTIIVDNCVLSDPVQIANHFNNFFTTMPHNIVSEIHPTDRPPDLNLDFNATAHDNIPLFSFNDVPLTSIEITGATMQLQCKFTEDMSGISVALLQKIIAFISEPLRHIFTLSFANGIVPQQLKVAKVIPIFKSGCKESLDNY